MRAIKFELVEDNKIVGYETYSPNYNGGVWYYILYAEGRDAPCHCKTYWPGDFNQLVRRQYTGLEDQNGKEIYEGDLFWYDWHDSLILRVVEFYDGSFIGRDAINHIIPMEFLGNFFIRDLEVIGNIYENPELLGA